MPKDETQGPGRQDEWRHALRMGGWKNGGESGKLLDKTIRGEDAQQQSIIKVLCTCLCVCKTHLFYFYCDNTLW